MGYFDRPCADCGVVSMARRAVRSTIFARALDQYREARYAYDDYLESQYARANDDTNGVLLNQRGRNQGVSSFSLFSGNRVRMEAYASEELKDWFRKNGRITYTEWEAQYHG